MNPFSTLLQQYRRDPLAMLEGLKALRECDLTPRARNRLSMLGYELADFDYRLDQATNSIGEKNIPQALYRRHGFRLLDYLSDLTGLIGTERAVLKQEHLTGLLTVPGGDEWAWVPPYVARYFGARVTELLGRSIQVGVLTTGREGLTVLDYRKDATFLDIDVRIQLLIADELVPLERTVSLQLLNCSLCEILTGIKCCALEFEEIVRGVIRDEEERVRAYQEARRTPSQRAAAIFNVAQLKATDLQYLRDVVHEYPDLRLQEVLEHL